MDCRRYRDAMYVQRSQRRHWVWMYQRRRPYNDNRQVWRQRRLDRWGQLGLEYISIGRTVVITMTMTTTRAVRSINGLKLQTSEPWKRMLKDLHINWPPIKIKKKTENLLIIKCPDRGHLLWASRCREYRTSTEPPRLQSLMQYSRNILII